MARKEILYLTGNHILISMVLIGNLLVVGFLYRYHTIALFRLEQKDLQTFTRAQHDVRIAKEEIRVLEKKTSWNDTAYAKRNPWSVSGDELK